MPQRLSGISRIDADYDICTRAIGCYNAAFELWLTRTCKADSADITTEIMIWVSRKGLRSAGSFLKSVATPLGAADLCEALSMPWRYLAFVLDQEMLTGRINLHFFLEQVMALGRADPSLFLASVEFGNEIAFGQGQTWVNRYG